MFDRTRALLCALMLVACASAPRHAHAQANGIIPLAAGTPPCGSSPTQYNAQGCQITSDGIYLLTQRLVAPTGGANAITITNPAQNVTIDLNGYSIDAAANINCPFGAQPTGTAQVGNSSGIFISNGANAVASISDGSIRGFPIAAINAVNGGKVNVDSVFACAGASGQAAMVVGTGSTIKNTEIRGGSHGVLVNGLGAQRGFTTFDAVKISGAINDGVNMVGASGVLIRELTSTLNGGHGINAAQSRELAIQGPSNISGNGLNGIEATNAHDMSIQGPNAIAFNGGTGVNGVNSSGMHVADASVSRNGVGGIMVGRGSRVVGNVVRANGVGTGLGFGLIVADETIVRTNTVTCNGNAFNLDILTSGTGNSVLSWLDTAYVVNSGNVTTNNPPIGPIAPRATLCPPGGLN